MEITKRASGDLTELEVSGRLDGYWADHLASALEAEIRQGSHQVRLDLSQVVFLSSAGIGILVKFYNQLKNIQGSLSISKSSEQVRKVLEISGLKDVLLTTMAPAAGSSAGVAGAPAATTAAPVSQPPVQIEKPGATFEVHTLASESGTAMPSGGRPGLARGLPVPRGTLPHHGVPRFLLCHRARRAGRTL